MGIDNITSLDVISPSQQELKKLLEYYQTGRFDDAEKLAVSITQEFPKHPFSWKVLGAVFGQTRRQSNAINASKKVVALSPEDAEAHNNLGIAFQELGRLDEAEASYAQAIVLKSDFVEAHSNLGITLQKLGRLDEAESSLRQAITFKSDFAKAHNNLGNTLQELGRLDEAEASLKHAIALKTDYAEAHNNLGITFQELYRLDEAEASYMQAIALKPDFAEAHNNLGNALKELGRLDEAEASYAQAITLKSDFIEAHNNLGIALQQLGRLDEAESSYMQAIALKSDYAKAHRHLSLMKKFDSQDEQYLKMRELYLDKNTSEDQRCNINFGLAKACEDLGFFEQAFQHYSEGNMLRKRLLNYDISQDIELFNQLKLSYPQLARNSIEIENPAKKLMPIFIVGMPRSGTTLVEQIISSHSQVTGAGELSFVAQFGSAIAQGLSDSSTDALLKFRKKYLMKLQNFSNLNPVVTDKMPQNFLYIGLLAAAFPEAKIVHVKRNPAALCWANYKQYFVSKNLGYCYELGDIIKYYGLYRNLMEFWSKGLNNRIYDFNYELLTINQEDETRKLINYLGLEWDEKCLSPQDNTRSVATASNIQVRQKVYLDSSQKWKIFKPFLKGVLDYLDD